MPIPRSQIAGIVLAGGKGERMGGADKGLMPLQDLPLAAHALARLRPQVDRLMVSANRNLEAYAALGVPVWPDPVPGQPGPLAGFLAGMRQAGRPWLMTVPCDAPDFPEDLVQRLAGAAAASGAQLAIPACPGERPDEPGRLRTQPVFCLMQTALADALQQWLLAGGRRVGDWTAAQSRVVVEFERPSAFRNLNSLHDLRQAGQCEATPGSPGTAAGRKAPPAGP